MASCNAAGIITSRISTDWTVTPHGFERSSINFCNSSSMRSRPRSTADRLRIILYFQGRLFRIVNHPEQHCIDVDRDGIARQGLFRGERGRNHTLIDPGGYLIDKRHEPEKSRTAQPDIFTEPENYRALPLARDLWRLSQQQTEQHSHNRARGIESH